MSLTAARFVRTRSSEGLGVGATSAQPTVAERREQEGAGGV